MKKFKNKLMVQFQKNNINKKNFLVCVDRFFKYPTIEMFDETIWHNVVNFLDEYIQFHGVPRNIRLCPLGNKIIIFC